MWVQACYADHSVICPVLFVQLYCKFYSLLFFFGFVLFKTTERHKRCGYSINTSISPWIDTSHEVQIQYRYQYQSLNRSIRHKRCVTSPDTSTSPWIDWYVTRGALRHHTQYVTRGALPVPVPVPVPKSIDTSQEVRYDIIHDTSQGVRYQSRYQYQSLNRYVTRGANTGWFRVKPSALLQYTTGKDRRYCPRTDCFKLDASL
jgi:hypothetical protein